MYLLRIPKINVLKKEYALRNAKFCVMRFTRNYLGAHFIMYNAVILTSTKCTKCRMQMKENRLSRFEPIRCCRSTSPQIIY